ncbi:MAG: hypothetical protein NVS3B7_00560 [Candidatus Elarobacter sp.]
MRRRERIALALATLAAACGPHVSPAFAQGAPAGMGWCRTLPLEKSFCRALVIDAPKGSLRLAVADDDGRREHGLMGVLVVPRGEGMIFVFPDDGNRERGFWMKDTVAPLDMVFVRNDGLVSSIAARVPATKPHARDDEIARRNGVGRFVIELRAGGAAEAGLRPGSRLVLPALPAH